MEFHGITSKEKRTSSTVQIPLGNWTLFNKDRTLYSNGWTWQHKTQANNWIKTNLEQKLNENEEKGFKKGFASLLRFYVSIPYTSIKAIISNQLVCNYMHLVVVCDYIRSSYY